MNCFSPLLSLVAVLALIVITVLLVVVLLQLRRTLQRVDTLLTNTERELTPLLSNLRESSEQLKAASTELQHGLQRAGALFDAIGAVGDSINAVHHSISRYRDQFMAIWSGFQIVREFFRKPVAEEETVGGE